MRRLLAVSAVLAIAVMAVSGGAVAKEPPEEVEIGISGGDLDRELRTPAVPDLILETSPKGKPTATPYRLTLYGRFPGEPAVRSLVAYDLYLDAAGRPTILRQLEPLDWLTLSDEGVTRVERALSGAGIKLQPPKTVAAAKPSPSNLPAILAVVAVALLAIAVAGRLRFARRPAPEARA